MENVSKFKAIQKIAGPIFLMAVMAFSFAACEGPQGNTGETGPQGSDKTGTKGPEGLTPHVGDNCNWWVGEDDTGVLAGHKDFDGVICRACGNIEGMAALKGGTFSMGQGDISDTNPIRSVTVSSFKMARYQVTQDLYFKVMGNNPSNFDGTSGKEPAVYEIQGKRPVEQINWYDAVEFCNKLSERGGLTPVYTITDRDPLTGPITSATVSANWNANGYRLPTEAEWEYACRAGTTTQWSFGDTEGDDESGLRGYAWYTANSSPSGDELDRRTHQVGLKLPNAFGLYDMHGNVGEWCWDWSGAYKDNPPNENPKGPDEGESRMVRGGGWESVTNYTRSAARTGYYPDIRAMNFGLRLVRR